MNIRSKHKIKHEVNLCISQRELLFCLSGRGIQTLGWKEIEGHLAELCILRQESRHKSLLNHFLTAVCPFYIIQCDKSPCHVQETLY